MTNFIQLHLLTSYPPANLNRDDLGRPKTAKMGGVDRLRISSQSLKRAWRTSALFEDAFSGHIGERTKLLGLRVYKDLLDKGMKPKLAEKIAHSIAAVFGKPKSQTKKNDEADNDFQHLTIEQLVHISPQEKDNIDSLLVTLLAEKREPNEKELKELLSSDKKAVDIALFGRMLASSVEHNVDAAVQVAHSISVHPVVVEEDYFTAIDDLAHLSEKQGAAHIDEGSFGSALFYSYICIDRNLLLKHLNNDRELVNKTLGALTEAAAKISPKGKQNSFASRAYASYILAEIGDQQPRSLSVAFLKPVMNHDYATTAIAELQKHRESFDKVYGACAKDYYEINTLKSEGNLQQLINFICA